MSTERITRVNEVLKREVAEALFHFMNEAGFDLSAVTVTRVITSPDLRHARVMVSIRDHENERKRMLHQIEAHRKELQQVINKRAPMKYTPQLIFELDLSIEKGDKVLHIIESLEAAGAISPAQDDVPPADDHNPAQTP